MFVSNGWSDPYLSCFSQCRTRMMRTWKGPGKELCELANEVWFEALNRWLWPFNTLITRSRCSAVCGETLKICFDSHHEPLSDLCICSIASYTECRAPYNQTFTESCPQISAEYKCLSSIQYRFINIVYTVSDPNSNSLIFFNANDASCGGQMQGFMKFHNPREIILWGHNGRGVVRFEKF